MRVDTWGPLVFVNLDLDAEPLAEFLEEVPDDCAWARLDEMRCLHVGRRARRRCNWKTLIDGFSETYHVQGIHREMLPMCDDVNGPQRVWHRHGKLEQSYGLPSPRLRDDADDQQVWEAFVEIMGVRVGNLDQRDAGPAPDVAPTAARCVRRSRRSCASAALEGGHEWFAALDDGQLLDMQQYNLFPNLTVLVFSDMVQVVRVAPGRDARRRVHGRVRVRALRRRRPVAAREAGRDRASPRTTSSRSVSSSIRTSRTSRAASAGMHQPGLTHLTVSPTEECRIVNLHRNLEEYLGLESESTRRARSGCRV